MQWLIDLIQDWVKLYFKGMIVMWSGTVDNIPEGWALCDGSNGTPNLRYRFVPGASLDHPPHETGGSINHHHNFTTDGHNHAEREGQIDGYATGFPDIKLQPATDTGTTEYKDHLPPYYVLAFIMKL